MFLIISFNSLFQSIFWFDFFLLFNFSWLYWFNNFNSCFYFFFCLNLFWFYGCSNWLRFRFRLNNRNWFNDLIYFYWRSYNNLVWLRLSGLNHIWVNWLLLLWLILLFHISVVIFHLSFCLKFLSQCHLSLFVLHLHHWKCLWVLSRCEDVSVLVNCLDCRNNWCVILLDICIWHIFRLLLNGLISSRCAYLVIKLLAIHLIWNLHFHMVANNIWIFLFLFNFSPCVFNCFFIFRTYKPCNDFC